MTSGLEVRPAGTTKSVVDVAGLAEAWGQSTGFSSVESAPALGAAILAPEPVRNLTYRWNEVSTSGYTFDSLELTNAVTYRVTTGTMPSSATFRRLADEWRRDTEWLSSVQQKAMHPAYQRIIGMGPFALQWIFDELRQRPAYWYWALAAITGEDPAEGQTKMAAARTAWLGWAEEHGY